MSEAPVESAELLERLGSADRTAQRLACDELAARLHDDPGLRGALLGRLRDGTPLARFASAFVLFNAERPSMRLLPALLDALEIPDGDVRWQATHMLATLGRLEGEVLPVLLHEVHDAELPTRRRMALYALRELAPERLETCAAFLRALDDADAGVRLAALTCFAKLGDPQRAALDRVAEIARSHADPRMSRIAVIVLPDLVAHHPDVRDEVTTLLESLRSSTDASLARAAEASVARLCATRGTA